MAGTRSSARKTANNSDPVSGDETLAGSKRKPEAEPPAKRDRKAPKKQTTIEETIGGKEDEDHEMKDAQSDSDQAGKRDKAETNDTAQDKLEAEEGDDEKNKKSSANASGEAADDTAKSTTTNAEQKTDDTAKNGNSKGDGAIEQSSQREQQVPSNILEKGVIYFFTRNRVGIDGADSVGDLQRTFFVLRPLPLGAKLGDGAVQDLKNNRLFALPKKTFPKSHSDRFMAFVEKANSTIQDLKENFMQGSKYETKTQGTRQVDPVTPVAEGVYAITRTEDATTHLVYSTTIPSKLGEIQEDLGIKDQGSFIISVKNPERSGPASAQLPQKPDFPKEIIEEFRGLAWSEVKPKYIDYEYCQILLIGEKIDAAVEPTKKDQKHDKETPQEELEKLEHEDELRVEHLHGNDSVYDDLQISKKEYPQVPTTW